MLTESWLCASIDERVVVVHKGQLERLTDLQVETDFLVDFKGNEEEEPQELSECSEFLVVFKWREVDIHELVISRERYSSCVDFANLEFAFHLQHAHLLEDWSKQLSFYLALKEAVSDEVSRLH